SPAVEKANGASTQQDIERKKEAANQRSGPNQGGEWEPSYGPRSQGDTQSESLTSYFFYDSERCAVEYEASVGWSVEGAAISESRSLALSFFGEKATGTLERSYEVRAERL